MHIVKLILEILLYSILALFAYIALRTYVLQKIKVSKWIVLVLAFTVFLVPNLLWPTMPMIVSRYVIPLIFIILFLWFMDLCGFMKGMEQGESNSKYYDKYNKSNNKVIKPKAKPNRIKNNK